MANPKNLMEKDPKVEAITSYLVNNPKYESDWIAEASTILAKDIDYLTEEALAKYPAGKLKVVNEILADDINININMLLESGLNWTQMELYYAGIKNGVSEEDMKIFLNPEISYAKSNFAIQAIIEGYNDIVNYMDYSVDQLVEIYACMKEGIDVKAILAISNGDVKVMNFIRHGINIGLECTLMETDSAVSFGLMFTK